MIDLKKGDTIEIMKTMPDDSVDAIICDLPYGTTSCKWDAIIPLDEMWEQFLRITKETSPIVLTAQQPFTSALIMSNIRYYRYNWVWDKGYSTGFANANKMPMKGFEDICVFYKKLPTYNPQGLIAIEPKIKTRCSGGAGEVMGKNGTEGKEYISKYTNYPNGFIKTTKEKTKHPTGKSVKLMEYLVLTYTNENDVVFDATMGSGTTGVACVNTGRNFIGIEKDDKYYEVAKERITPMAAIADKERGLF